MKFDIFFGIVSFHLLGEEEEEEEVTTFEERSSSLSYLAILASEVLNI